MDVDGVRMYHDQALFKEPGGGFTPWHADQYYWPLASDRSITVWIPLQATPLEMGPLQFAVGSQRCHFGRDLEISDHSEAVLARGLRDLPVEVSGFELGEVSFHAGWTFHRAGPNTTAKMRAVMTMIYIDADMRLAQPANRNQESDRQQWCPGVAIGSRIDSPLNPVVWAS
jgi:ectoine hydroxylase-related dioxygenase (phytanoyl-CoA dioxygenase family)